MIPFSRSHDPSYEPKWKEWCSLQKARMFVDTTVPDRELKKEINDLVGKPFSLLKMFKIGAIGSHRMIVSEYSDKFREVLTRSTDLNYCNLELRPKGVIVHLSKDRSRHSWIIPYYKLALFDSKTFSIHADGQYLRIQRDRYWKMNKKFHRKLLLLKEEVMSY